MKPESGRSGGASSGRHAGGELGGIVTVNRDAVGEPLRKFAPSTEGKGQGGRAGVDVDPPQFRAAANVPHGTWLGWAWSLISDSG